MYSPILRNRQSELLAIKHLSTPIRTLMMPVLDLAAPTKSADQAAGLKYVEGNLERTRKYATGFPAVFVDSSEIDPGFRLALGVHPLDGIATAVAEAGCTPIPITGLHRDAAHKATATSIANDRAQGKVCVRLDATDVSTATLTFKRLRDLLNASSVESSAVYLLVDLQCLFGKNVDAVAKEVLRFFKLIEASEWAGIMVGGYAIPDQLSTAVATKEQAYLRRIEQDVFRIAAGYEMDTPRWFADYTILPPSIVELDWRLIRKVMSPKALYTLADGWFVVRGGAFSSHPDGYDQYYSIAEEIVALDEFYEPSHSYGDNYIFDRSNKDGKPGSPASWITACVNHHLTLTANAHK
jgi:Beta protein